LSSRHPVGYIDIRTSAHATEDTDKVMKALGNILPAELVQTVTFRKTSLAGHHGNPITLFETRIKERNAAQKTLERLSSGLGMMDKDGLNSEIQQHLEKGNLYLRLDKQAAYLNEIRLCRTDPIHLRIHFKRSRPEEVIEICRRLGLLP
jgi:RNA binding exosome subunit